MAEKEHWVTLKGGQHILIGGKAMSKRQAGAHNQHRITAEVLDLGRKAQDYVAKVIGGKSTTTENGVWHPIDVLKGGKYAVEVKSRQDPTTRLRCNMEGGERRQRKHSWCRRNGYKLKSTVGVDTTTKPWTLYWQRGFGAYFYSKMVKVTPAQLKKLYQ